MLKLRQVFDYRFMFALLIFPQMLFAQEKTTFLTSPADYLMDEKREIALARSAAPDKVSQSATIMVLRKNGFETVIEGSNGFVCLVLRSWGNPTFDPRAAYVPEIIAPECCDANAVKTILPIQLYRHELGLKGTPPEQIKQKIMHGFFEGRFKEPDNVAFGYMMSSAMNLGAGIGNWVSHMMVYAPYYNNEMLGGFSWNEGHPFVEEGLGKPFTVVTIPMPNFITPKYENP